MIKAIPKKIESVEIVEKAIDSTQIEVKKNVDSISVHSSKEKTESIIQKKPIPTPSIPALDGMIIVTGDIDKHEKSPIHPDSIVDPQYPEIEGEKGIYEDIVFGMLDVEKPIEFPNTPTNLSRNEKQNYFNSKMNELVTKNFNIAISKDLGLKGKQRMQAQFTVDTLGAINDIKVRGPHKLLEEELLRFMNLLPKFIPAKHEGRKVSVSYALPFAFNIED
ncbi:energy transducer TonB [Psychroserpens luteus]|uniref:Energy transducer TonB n=1 Tax=Psychroserpens luteus TaxID=1434066 RepID=A0ABW5ZQ39_9FLAO|nr:energy transducer TonB [Psychroserpens luteus]